MAKTFWIINRTLIGPALENISVNWRLADDPRRGHPLVHSRGPVDFDYFRRSMARYYSWRYGSGPSDYQNFGYLSSDIGSWNLSDQTTAAPVQLRIGFNIPQESPPLAGSSITTILDYGWYNQQLAVLQTAPNTYSEIQNLMAMPDVDPNPYGPRPNMGYEFLDSMLITADQNRWESISDQFSVIPSMETLIYEPTADYGNWQAYVVGAEVAPFSPPRQWPGILGYGMTDKTFFDHVTQRECPNSIVVTADFNSFNTFFSNLATNPYVEEVYVPNLYMVASVLQENTSTAPVYKTIYSAYDAAGNEIYVGSAANQVKEYLSLVTAPPSGEVPAAEQPDILDGTSPFSAFHVPASAQAPNTLLSRFARKDFTNTTGLARAANINRHLGLPYNLVKGDIPSEMNGLRGAWPYSISVEYADPNSQSQFIKSIWLQNPNDASLLDQTEAMADFFLYEVMKANILDFENASDHGSTGTGVEKEDWIYESIPVSAVQVETGVHEKYYGFDWMTAPGQWAYSTQDLEPYSVRAIDIGNLFKNIFKYQLDSTIPEGFYNTSDKASEQSCNGFMGQSPEENIVDASGLIIGKVFNSTAQAGVKNSVVMLDGLAQIGMNVEDLMNLFIHTADYYSQNMRTYEQMLDGVFAHRDTILFKLDKHTVNPVDNKPSQDPIQSIYIANVGGATEYVDTQIFSSKKYMYKLYAYDLVVGNQYKYINPEVFPPPPSRYPNPLAYLLNKFEDRNLHVLDAPMILPWSATGPGGKLRITGVGSSFENNSYVAGANIDVNYPSWVDMSLGPSDEAYRPALALSQNARITLSDMVNRIGYEDWEALASSLEAVMNFMISMYYSHPDAGPEYILNNNAIGRYLNEVRVRAVKKDGTVYLFVGTVASLLAGGRNSAERIAFAESWPVDPDGYDVSNPFPLGLVAQNVSPYHHTPLEGDQTLDPYEIYFNLWMSSTDPMVQATEGFDAPAYTAAEAEARGAIAPFPISWDLLTGQHGEDPDLPWDTSRIGEAEVSVFNYKSPKILEIPIAESQVIEVLDLPPQYPDVEIFPLKGSNKEIKILLNSNFTKGVYSPIIIEPGDEEVFNAQRIAQGRPLPVDGGEAPILFGSDDYGNTTYQVFRVTDPPTSYQDFADNRTHTLLGTTEEGSPVESVSLRDFVDPNVTYYYCFRTIDKNGYPSNPTPILRVQVVDDNGRIYPLIEPYDFNLDDPRDTERSFKRYLEIDTSIQERMVSALPMNQTASAGSPYMAPSVSIGNTIWDGSTEFKIRITSKDTGRKIDLNLNFTVETIPNPNLPGN